MSMEYSGKHAAILINDILLEWGRESLIIPQTVDENDEFIFKGDVKKTGRYFTELAHSRPKTDDELVLFEDEIRVLGKAVEIKTRIIKKVIDIIIEFNSQCYYNSVCRNCQHFVKKIITDAAMIDEPKFLQDHEEYLHALREGKIRVPHSFTHHEDVDAYVMKKRSNKELEKLTKEDLGVLIRAYDTHHSGKDCKETGCQHNDLLRLLADKD